MLFPEEQELIDRIGVALMQRRERMGTAESCTGGLIAAACTSLSGSSQWFERGVVSYSDSSKTEPRRACSFDRSAWFGQR